MKHEELLAKYARMRGSIGARLSEFSAVGKKGGKTLFSELCFCLLTPQSKARSCDAAVRELVEKGLLLNGSAAEIAKVLSKKTRFHNNKAKYIVGAREKFAKGRFASLQKRTFSESERAARQYFLRNVKGLGLKEASHYLRNVGRGETLAILDRHILKNLAECGAIARVPKSLSEKKYLEIEKKMEKYCGRVGIPLSHLDLLFWAEETGEIFK